MKKLLPGLLLFSAAALLLAGCGRRGEPAVTAAPTEEPPAAETPAPTQTPEPTPPPVSVTIYVPGAEDLTVLPRETAIPEDSGRALLAALVEAGSLPDADFGKNLYIEAGVGTAKIKGEKTVGRLVRADFSKEFGDAVKELPSIKKEKAAIQCLVNTFLAYYGADAMTLTIEATTLETKSGADYEHGMLMDMFVPREKGELHAQTLTLRATVTDDETGEVTEAEESFPVEKGKRCSVRAKKAGLNCTIQALGGNAVMVETKDEMNLMQDDQPVGEWKQFLLGEGAPVTLAELKETPGKTAHFTLLLSEGDPA